VRYYRSAATLTYGESSVQMNMVAYYV